MRGGQVECECVCVCCVTTLFCICRRVHRGRSGLCEILRRVNISRCPGRNVNTKHLLLLVYTSWSVFTVRCCSHTSGYHTHGMMMMASIMCRSLTLFIICMALHEGKWLFSNLFMKILFNVVSKNKQPIFYYNNNNNKMIMMIIMITWLLLCNYWLQYYLIARSLGCMVRPKFLRQAWIVYCFPLSQLSCTSSPAGIKKL